MLRLTPIAMATGLLASAAACAQASPPLPPPLEVATRNGIIVEKSFDVGSGLRGWVTRQGGERTIVYTTADGKYVLVGSMFDVDGRNLTRDHSEAHLPKPDYSALFARLEKAPYVVAGERKNPKAILYGFYDPNCSFCYLAKKALAPYMDAGLQVRWVMVSVLGPNSAARSAAILQAADPAAALAEHMRLYNPAKPGSGLAPAADIGLKAKAALEEGGTLMADFGFRGTPAFVWRDAKGQVQVRAGMMQLSDIPAMTGMPFIPNDDPDLARFR